MAYRQEPLPRGMTYEIHGKRQMSNDELGTRINNKEYAIQIYFLAKGGG